MAHKKKELTPVQAMQKKTFTGWANGYLLENMLAIEDLENAFQDGLLLIQFCETISNKKIPKRNWTPKNNMQKLENINIALDFLKSEGLKFVNLDAKVVFDGNVDMLLGMMWTIILRYQVDTGDTSESPKTKLLKWMSEVTGEDITNFKCFPDGVVLTKLVNHLGRLKNGDDSAPLVPNEEETRGDKVKGAERNAKGMWIAEDEFGIRQIIDAPVLSEDKPEELSIMTYISYYMAKDKELRRRRLAQKELDPNHAYAEGPGLKKAAPGVPAKFKIYAVNGDGTPRPQGGDKFEVDVLNEKRQVIPCNVTDNGDGSYNAEYVATVPGKLIVAVKCWDTVFEKMSNIQDSPFSVDCKDDVDVNKTRVHGPGVEKGDTCNPAIFQIDAVSTNGQPMTKGGMPFVVSCKDPAGGDVPVALTDNKNGTYTCQYEPLAVGDHVVEVTYEGEQVGGGPFTVPIVEGTDASKCTVTGPGVEGPADTMTPAEFRITAFDKNGQQKPGGGDPFVVEVKKVGKASTLDAPITDNGDGTYDVVYKPKEAGDYEVSVKLNNKPVGASPYKLTVEEGVDPDKCVLLQSVFTLQTRTHDGENKTEGGDEITATVNNVAGEVVDNQDGTYTITVPVMPGAKSTEVHITIEGETPEWSPIVLKY